MRDLRTTLTELDNDRAVRGIVLRSELPRIFRSARKRWGVYFCLILFVVVVVWILRRWLVLLATNCATFGALCKISGSPSTAFALRPLPLSTGGKFALTITLIESMYCWLFVFVYLYLFVCWYLFGCFSVVHRLLAAVWWQCAATNELCCELVIVSWMFTTSCTANNPPSSTR